MKASFSVSISFESLLFIYWQNGSPQPHPSPFLIGKLGCWFPSCNHCCPAGTGVWWPRWGAWTAAWGPPQALLESLSPLPGPDPSCFVCAEERCRNVLARWHLIYQLPLSWGFGRFCWNLKDSLIPRGLLPTTEIEKLGRYANSNWVWVVLITS